MRTPWRRMAVVLAAAGFVLLFTAFYPYRQLSTSRAQLDQAKVELAHREQEKAALEQQVARLQQPDEIERQARERFGLARPGEVPFVIVSDTAPPAP